MEEEKKTQFKLL